MTNLKSAIGTSNSNLMNMKTDVNTTMNQAKNTNDSVNVLQSQVTLNKDNIATNTSSIVNIQPKLISIGTNVQGIVADVNALKNTTSSQQTTLTTYQTTLSARQMTIDIDQKSIHDLTSRITADETNSKLFVKSKDKANNIQLKYETNANGNKGINAYVDGNKVQVSSPIGNVMQNKRFTLYISGMLSLNNITGVCTTTGDVIIGLNVNVYTYLATSYGNIPMENPPDTPKSINNFTTPLGTSFTSTGPPDCIKLTTDYLNQHLDEFKSRFYQANPNAHQPTEISVSTNMG